MKEEKNTNETIKDVKNFFEFLNELHTLTEMNILFYKTKMEEHFTNYKHHKYCKELAEIQKLINSFDFNDKR